MHRCCIFQVERWSTCTYTSIATSSLSTHSHESLYVSVRNNEPSSLVLDNYLIIKHEKFSPWKSMRSCHTHELLATYTQAWV